MSLITTYGAPTYRFRVGDLTPASAAPTDVITLSGVAGKVIRVTRFSISGSATAAAILDIYLSKRTAANTGGTSTSQAASITSMDSIDPPASATVLLYTVNATALGAGSPLEGDKIYVPNQSTPTAEPTHIEYDWGITPTAKLPTLRSANESISLNFAGATLPAGLSLYVMLEWTEDSV